MAWNILVEYRRLAFASPTQVFSRDAVSRGNCGETSVNRGTGLLPSEHHSLVMVSSRFRVVLATVVQAATSAGSSFGLHLLSPTLIRCNAEVLFRRYSTNSC
jgi:hypothetical protein